MQDPVCGMEVTGQPAATAEHQGRRYEFCSTECKRRFEQEPDRYAKSA